MKKNCLIYVEYKSATEAWHAYQTLFLVTDQFAANVLLSHSMVGLKASFHPNSLRLAPAFGNLI